MVKKETALFDRFSQYSFSEIQQLREHSFDQLLRGRVKYPGSY